MWPVTLSGRLPVKALVGHHPTNKLIGREPIPHQKNLSNNNHATIAEYPVLATVSGSYPKEGGRLLTCYSPVRHSHQNRKRKWIPFDLHVLSTPPAFVLSQDQTLRKKTNSKNHQPNTKNNVPANPPKKRGSQPNKTTHTHQKSEHRPNGITKNTK